MTPAQIADLIARLDRLEALVARHVQPVDFLTPALRRVIGDTWFTSGEAFRLAQTEAEAAASVGLPEPALAEAMRLEGVRTSHGLARWLAARAGQDGIERSARAREGVLWRVSP